MQRAAVVRGPGHRSRGLIGLAAALALTMLLGPVAGVRAASVGIVDASPANLTAAIVQPLWAGLKVKQARTLTPWNIATRSDGTRQAFDAWLAAVRQRGIEPYVTFWQGYAGDTPCPRDVCRAPTAADYASKIDAFVRAYPDVKLIGAWNEPNYDDQTPDSNGNPPRIYRTPDNKHRLSNASCPKWQTTDNCGPLTTASYWGSLNAACAATGCTAIAGEFTGNYDAGRFSSNRDYVPAYQSFLRGLRPKVWTIHPYGDVNRYEKRVVTGQRDPTLAPITRAFADQLRGSWSSASEIWLSAIGAYWRGGSIPGDAKRAERDALQRRATEFILRIPTIPQLGGEVTRLYLYNVQNRPNGSKLSNQDRGLVAPPGATYDQPGRVRPAYGVIAGRPGAGLIAGPGIPPPSPPPPSPAPPPPSPPVPPPPPGPVCATHAREKSVVCIRDAGHTVDVCDRDADGHRVYARVVTEASNPDFRSPFYDDNDSHPGCANLAFPSRVLRVAVCVQYEGCGAYREA